MESSRCLADTNRVNGESSSVCSAPNAQHLLFSSHSRSVLHFTRHRNPSRRLKSFTVTEFSSSPPPDFIAQQLMFGVPFAQSSSLQQKHFLSIKAHCSFSLSSPHDGSSVTFAAWLTCLCGKSSGRQPIYSSTLLLIQRKEGI